jgi:neurotransmitter:Na+ symporter, NSS family
MEDLGQKKASWTGSLGFILAAAGSAVGLGNIWRFPYLAAQDGGGLFVIIYLLLVFTFGSVLLTTDIVIGRKTGKHALQAYGAVHPKWKFLGILSFIVPSIILPYYILIGGWVTKYMGTYVIGQGAAAATDGYFTSFITDPALPVIFMIVYLLITAVVIYFGVEKGIEKFSKYIMPALFILVFGLAIYSLTIKGEHGTGIDGLKVYLIPNFEGVTFSKFLSTVMDALSQIFFSLSVAMGIMISYGSYVKKETNLSKSIAQIEIFDTLVAFLAGLMIIPAIYAISGAEGMTAGPGLIFVALPKIFSTMGVAGQVVGALFFIMVEFAALTSSVSIMEPIVGSCMEWFHMSRKKVVVIVTAIAGIIGTIICFGYSFFYFEVTLPNGSTGQLLDIFDYVSNNVLMPIVAFLTCILIGWVVEPKWAIEELEYGGLVYRKKHMYAVMIKYIIPVLLLLLFLNATGLFSAIGS